MSNLRGEDEFEKEQKWIRERELKEQMVQKVCFLTVCCAVFFHLKKCRSLGILGSCL